MKITVNTDDEYFELMIVDDKATSDDECHSRVCYFEKLKDAMIFIEALNKYRDVEVVYAC